MTHTHLHAFCNVATSVHLLSALEIPKLAAKRQLSTQHAWHLHNCNAHCFARVYDISAAHTVLF